MRLELSAYIRRRFGDWGEVDKMMLCSVARDFFSFLGGVFTEMKSLPAKGGEEVSGAHGALWEWNGSVLSVLGGTREAMYCRLV